MPVSVAEARNSVVLVEGFVTKESEETVAPSLPKRSKIDPSTDANVPAITAGDGAGDVIKHFYFALKCWNLLNSTDAFQKGEYPSFQEDYFLASCATNRPVAEFSKLKQHVKLDSWMSDFTTDVALYRGKFDEFQVNVLANAGDIRSNLQKLTFKYITRNYRVSNR